jgi:hypothetical protein
MVTGTLAMKTETMLSLLIVLLAIAGCAPEVGSERWCNQLKEKPKGEWTANEAADFARHCLFK